MKIEELKKEYDKLQLKYGDKELDSIYNGGLENNPDICFVFMNPTKRNIASSKEWKGLKSPWIGTKNIWSLFYDLGLLDKDVYDKIMNGEDVIVRISGYCVNTKYLTKEQKTELTQRVFHEVLSMDDAAETVAAK